MNRPYPVSEKVAGLMLAGCTKADFIVCTGSRGQLPMHAPFRMDCLRTHEEE